MADYGGYEAGRDEQYSSRLDRSIQVFADEFDNDPSPNRRTIFLFPGGMGSQLVRSNQAYPEPSPTYYRSWLGYNILLSEAKNLRIAPDGVDYRQRYVVPDGGIDTALCHLRPYRNFIQWCQNNRLHLFVFGWDWRRGIQYSACFFLDVFMPKFDAWFAGHRPPHPMDNFTFIGHSAGGMVVKAILNQATNTYVKKVKQAITVATPFYGYGAQIHRFFKGDPDLNPTLGGPDAARSMTRIISSMPGGYEFLYLDAATYARNAACFRQDPYPLLAYPSMDKDDPSAVADPYNPTDAGRKVRYSSQYGFDTGLLQQGLAASHAVSSRLARPVASKFYNIRGVQAKNGKKLKGTVVGQTWARVPTTFNPDANDDPIKDSKGCGDGVQPAWTARLLSLPDPAKQVITVVGDIEHMTMMNARAVQKEIAKLLGLATVTYASLETAPVASRSSLNQFLHGLHVNVTDKKGTDARRRSNLAKYLSGFTQSELRALLARAYIDLLKSPSQKVGTTPQKKKAATAKAKFKLRDRP